MPRRRLSLTVALDWPRTAANASVFTAATEAEFLATKEPRFRGPHLGLGVVVRSSTLVGNKAIPRIWRRLIRYLQNAKVIAPTVDPWCYLAKVVEIPDDEAPSIELTLVEEA